MFFAQMFNRFQNSVKRKRESQYDENENREEFQESYLEINKRLIFFFHKCSSLVAHRNFLEHKHINRQTRIRQNTQQLDSSKKDYKSGRHLIRMIFVGQ